MKIAICGSLAFTYQFAELKEQLEAMGHEVEIPFTSRKILGGEFTLEEVEASKGGSESATYKASNDVIRRYYEVVKSADAILVANYQKNSINGYIGANTFLEMGFAHVLHIPIYVLNPMPESSFSDEMRAMQPIVLNGDLALFERQMHGN